VISPTLPPLYTAKRELSIAFDLARCCKHRPHLSRAAPTPCSPTISQLGDDIQPPIRGSNRRVGVRVFVPAHEYPRNGRPSEPRTVGSENSAPDPTTHSALHDLSLEDQHTGHGPEQSLGGRAISVGEREQRNRHEQMAPTLPTVGLLLRSIAQPAIYRDLPRNYPDRAYKLAASAR
jgi:hypothetical protein